MRKFIADARAKGATPVVCSLVPRKLWKDGRVVRNADSYAGWAAEVARREGVAFVDLNEIIARRYEELGPEKVEPLFADERTHTSRAGPGACAYLICRRKAVSGGWRWLRWDQLPREGDILELIYGFIGCGRMGRPMAQRLLDAGRKVVVCDASTEAVAALAAAGAQVAATPAEVARKAHTIYLSLPTPAIVHQVVLGPEGILAGSEARQVVDFSTIGPRTALEIAARLGERGIDFLDAPVSGGTAGARDGKLAIMVSGPNAAFEKARADMALFGKLFHVGEKHGQAQIMKLANNLLNVAAVALTSEAMVMGAKAGLDATLMLEIINAGTGRNSATEQKFPRAVLPGTFDYGFSTGLSYKDVGLCVDEAEAMGVPMVVGAAVRQLLAITNATHGPDSDFTSVCRVVEAWAGTEVRARRN